MVLAVMDSPWLVRHARAHQCPQPLAAVKVELADGLGKMSFRRVAEWRQIFPGPASLPQGSLDPYDWVGVAVGELLQLQADGDAQFDRERRGLRSVLRNALLHAGATWGQACAVVSP